MPHRVRTGTWRLSANVRSASSLRFCHSDRHWSQIHWARQRASEGGRVGYRHTISDIDMGVDCHIMRPTRNVKGERVVIVRCGVGPIQIVGRACWAGVIRCGIHHHMHRTVFLGKLPGLGCATAPVRLDGDCSRTNVLRHVEGVAVARWQVRYVERDKAIGPAIGIGAVVSCSASTRPPSPRKTLRG